MKFFCLHFAFLCGTVFTAWAGINEWTYVGMAPEAITDIEIHPNDPQTVFVASTDWFFDTTREGGIFKTTDHGLTWDTLGFRHFRVHDLFINPEHPDTIWAACDVAGLYRSTDGGSTWETRNTGLYLGGPDNYGAFAIALSPFNESVLLCGEASDVANGRLYRSTDGGETWTRVILWWNAAISKIVFDPFLPHRVWIHDPFFGQILMSVDSGQTFSPVNEQNLIVDFALDPFRPNWIWATGWDSVFYSTDAGTTWTVLNNDAPGGPQDNRLIHTSSMHPDALFLTDHTFIYFSTDGGVTWTIVNQGWPQQGAIVRTLTIFDGLVLELWAGTFYHGLITYTFGDTLAVSSDNAVRDKPIEMYPNPAKDRVTLTLSAAMRTRTITIYNILGQQVSSIPVDANRTVHNLDVRNLSSGYYILSTEPDGAEMGRHNRMAIITIIR